MPTRPCPTCQAPLPHDAAYCAQCGSATHTQVIGEAEPVGATAAVGASYEHEPGRLTKALGPQLELGALIGRGGYAEVFQVRDRKLNRDLAIKVIRPDLIVTPSLLARFRREALSVAALQHPAIVPVYDVGETDGICYIVMPLIRGESLKAVLQRQRRLPIDEVQRIVLEAANALAVAHEANVVHRDIKPENIMLEGRDRNVRLMDFGIAKAVDSSEKELTGTGVVVGTPAYMSPEQASGEPNIDHRSDQYSLAVVAYQMLSGRAPFEGETARAIIAKQLLDQPAALDTLVDNVPSHIVAALHRAMQKSPKNRFDSIKDFAAALQNPSYRNPPTIEPIGGPEPVRSIKWLPWAAGVAAVVVLGWVAVAELLPPRPVPPAPPAPQSPPQTIATRPTVDSPTAPTTATPIPVAPPPTSPVLRPDSANRDPGVSVPPTRPDTTPTAVAPPASCQVLAERQDWDKALPRCIEEAQGGNGRSAKVAAVVLAEGRGSVGADDGRAAPFYEQAARAGDAESQFWVARRAEAREPSLATDMYLAAARNRYERAYAIVATRFDRGLGIARDSAAAAHWYEEAAKVGDVPSQVRLADLYARGMGVVRSDSAARTWYERAATRGNSHEAQYQLAMIYFRGRGVKRSDEEGLRWLRLAAAGGHAEASKELAKRKG
ncbi:MAG: protein kinase [Gemmatimonadales bacterium]|nr:protein kinase [Gemmatimonadales bacterium]